MFVEKICFFFINVVFKEIFSLNVKSWFIRSVKEMFLFLENQFFQASAKGLFFGVKICLESSLGSLDLHLSYSIRGYKNFFILAVVQYPS